jgi:hypothetical protein
MLHFPREQVGGAFVRSRGAVVEKAEDQKEFPEGESRERVL